MAVRSASQIPRLRIDFASVIGLRGARAAGILRGA
jgi:hypothetical protein